MIAEQTDMSHVYLVTTNTGERPLPVKKTVTAAAIRAALSTNMPGSWSTDHRAETEKFTGWHYVGIHSIAVQAFQAELSVYDDGQKSDGDNMDLTGSDNPLTQFSQTGAKVSQTENSIPAGQEFVRKPAYKKDWLKKSRAATRAELKKTWGSKWKAMAAAQNEQAADALPDSEPFVKLLKKPNPTQGGGTMLYELAQQLELTGTAIVVWIPNGLGTPCEMYVVPTAVAEPRQPTREMPNGGFWINPAMARSYAGTIDPEGYANMRGFYRLIGAVVPAEQCIIIRWPHPIWKDDGQSPVAASALWTDTAEMADKARWGHLKRGPDPSVAITLSEEYNPDQHEIDRFKANIQRDYGGADKAGNVMVVTHGNEVTPLTTTPKDMSYETGFIQMRDSILAIHQVPAIAAGISDGGSFAAFVASLRQFITLKVQPCLSLIAQELTAKLSSFFGKGYTIEIDAATVDDPEAIEKMLATDGAYSIRTLNEARALRGLPDYPGPEGKQLLGAAGQAQQAAAMGGQLGPDGQPMGGGQFGKMPGEDAAQFPDGKGIPKGDEMLNDPASNSFQKEQGANADSAAGGKGPYQAESRRQWKRNITAIDDVMNSLIDGKYTPTRALVMLQSLGLPTELATALVQDAKDGKMDNEDKILGDGGGQAPPSNKPAFPKKKPPFAKTMPNAAFWDGSVRNDTLEEIRSLRKTINGRKFSSTQFNLSGGLKRQCIRLGEQIDPRDLAEDGLETDPHITVKYGLLTDDPREVRALLAGANPVEVRFGDLSLFEGDADDPSDFDVLKVAVDSSDIVQLNQLITDSLDNTTTHPNYQPHVTIAYLKAGRGRKYAEELANNLEGQTATFDRLVFSDPERNHTYLKLGVPALAAAKTLDPNEGRGKIGDDGIHRFYNPSTGYMEQSNGNGHAKTINRVTPLLLDKSQVIPNGVLTNEIIEQASIAFEARLQKMLVAAGLMKGYDPNEGRDSDGKWTEGGGGGTGGESGDKGGKAPETPATASEGPKTPETTPKPAGASTEIPRASGESDKEYAKRVIDKREAPKELPGGDQSKYFAVTKDSKTVPIDKLVSSKSPEENETSWANAAKRMQAATKGELSLRAPISVTPIGTTGKYRVLDGNGTLTAAQKYGWKEMAVTVTDDEHGAITLPPKMEKAKAVKEASQDIAPTAGYAEVKKHADVGTDDLKTLLDKGKGIGATLGYKTVQSEAEFNKAINEPGGVVIIAPPKTKESSERKVKKEYGGDWSKLLDASRASIAVDSLDELHDVLHHLEESHGIEVVRTKDRFTEPTDVGYRDIMLNVKTPNNGIGELQVHVKSMLRAKAIAHDYYDVMRVIKGNVKEEKRDMTAEETKQYNEARDKSLKIYNAAWKEVKG